MAGPMASTRTPGTARPPAIPPDHDIEIPGEIPAEIPGEPVSLADGERRDDRNDGREAIRIRPREPHERYHLDKRRMKKELDYFYAAAAIHGQPNPRFNEYFRAGWRPARAEDYPELSGFDVQTDPRLVELGYMQIVKPDDPVVDRGLMLMCRPKELSERSRDEEQRRATGQISDHLNRLQQSSRRAIGEKTQVQRRHSRGAPPADMIPEDAEYEE